MRTWSMIGVVAIFGFSTASTDAAAKGIGRQPSELIATISLGNARTLDSLRTFADAIQPGASAVLSDEMVRHQLAQLVEANALDGLDASAPRYVLLVDGGGDAKSAVVVSKVVDAKAFARGAGTAQTTISRGWGAIGPKAALARVATYALATLPSQPAVASPTAVIYWKQAFERYRDEIEASRTQMVTGASGASGTPQMSAIFTSYIDGMYGLLADGDQIVVTLDVTQDIGAIDVAISPKRGSRLETFVSAQRASDYALLDKLPDAKSSMIMVGHLAAGPYRAGLIDVMAQMFGASGKDLVDGMTAIMAATTGDVAMAMQMGGGKPMTMTELFGIADKRAADEAIDRVLAGSKTGRTIDMAGMSATSKTTSPVVRDGITLKGYDTIYDYSKLPAAQRERMNQMVPGGKTTFRIATFDALGLVTMGADPAVALDAARGKRDHFTPSADLATVVTGSRARKESVLIAMDLSTLLPNAAAGAPRLLMLSAGFADKTAHLRFAISAATVRTLIGRP